MIVFISQVDFMPVNWDTDPPTRWKVHHNIA